MDTLFRLHGTHSRPYNGDTASFRIGAKSPSHSSSPSAVVPTNVQLRQWTNKYFGEEATNKEFSRNIEYKIPDWASIELADLADFYNSLPNWAPQRGVILCAYATVVFGAEVIDAVDNAVGGCYLRTTSPKLKPTKP
jgi:hypothetical protein